MTLQGDTAFNAAILLNLAVSTGLAWVIYEDIIQIPTSLSWVVQIYISRTSYITVQALLRTRAVSITIKYCFKVLLYCLVLPFALVWQTFVISYGAVQRTRAQTKFKAALGSSFPLPHAPANDDNQVSTTGQHQTVPEQAVKQSYQYQKLWDTDEIRLLQVFPNYDQDAGQEILRGRIIHVRLSESPKFVALSYCWNDSDRPDPPPASYASFLRLDSEDSLLLTRNLFICLQSMRTCGHSATNLLWVDQICINQDDIAEKSSQVRLMKDIYTNAAYVLVWLGDDRMEEAGRAFRFAERVAQCIQEKGLLAPDFDFFPFNFAPNNFGLPPVYEAVEEYMLLMKILTRNWFQRSWVVQEVSLNPKKTVLCGNSQTSFEAIATALLFCTKSLDFLMDWVSPEAKLTFHAMIQSSMYARRQVAQPSSLLLDVLVRHRSCSSTLASDKVYAFLNLSTDQPDCSIEADYSVCSRTVFINTAISILEKSDNLDILGSAHAWPNCTTIDVSTTGTKDSFSGRCVDTTRACFSEDHAERLPSWVPDWSVPQLAPSFQFKGQTGEYFSRFKATGESKKNVQFRRKNTELGLEGHVLDRIIGVGPVFTESQGQGIGGYYRTLKCWGDMCGANNKRQQYKFAHETMLEAFANTLTCGGREAARISMKLGPDDNADTKVSEKDWLGNQKSFTGQLSQLWLVFQVNWMIDNAWPGIVQHTVIFNTLHTMLSLFVGLCYYFINLAGVGQPREAVSSGFRTRFFASVTNRRFIVTANGFIGLASPQAQPDDWVALISGSKVPIIIRDGAGPNGYGTLWKVAGDCYVHGAMFGECFLPTDKRSIMWFI